MFFRVASTAELSARFMAVCCRTAWLAAIKRKRSPQENAYDERQDACCRILDIDRTAVLRVCAMHRVRIISGSGPLNKGAQTPAGKMGIVQPGGAAPPPNAAPIANTANTANNPNNARAEIRGQSAQRSGRVIGLNGNRAEKDFMSPDSRSR
jgi:hypothetical protein